MFAFQVDLNGKRLCTAGVGDYGVLDAMVCWLRRKGHRTGSKKRAERQQATVNVGGLITSTDEHVRWQKRVLRVGDEVHIKIVEAASVDPPRHRKRRDPAQERRMLKKYVRNMAKDLGWRIQSLKPNEGVAAESAKTRRG